jgi:hypothetical protein
VSKYLFPIYKLIFIAMGVILFLSCSDLDSLLAPKNDETQKNAVILALLHPIDGKLPTKEH